MAEYLYVPSSYEGEYEEMTRGELLGIAIEAWERDERFSELIEEMYEWVTVAGMEFSPAEILKNLDPIAWRCMISDEFIEVNLDDFPAGEDGDEEEEN